MFLNAFQILKMNAYENVAKFSDRFKLISSKGQDHLSKLARSSVTDFYNVFQEQHHWPLLLKHAPFHLSMKVFNWPEG